MDSIQRWSEEKTEYIVDDLLTKVASVCSDQELRLLAEVLGRGHPALNADTLIQTFSRVGFPEGHRPYHLIEAISGKHGLMSGTFILSLIIGAARIRSGDVSESDLADAIKALDIEANSQLAKAIGEARTRADAAGKAWYDSISVVDALLGVYTLSDIGSRMKTVDWSKLRTMSQRYIGVARDLARKLLRR